MPTLYAASLGFLRRHPWQLALALLGICIGVAVMVRTCTSAFSCLSRSL